MKRQMSYTFAVAAAMLLSTCGGTDESIDEFGTSEATLTSHSTAPYVLRPRDVGLKYGPGLNALQWEPQTGKTATQLQRRVMIERLINVEVPKAFRWARTISTCSGSLSSIRATMNELTTELLPENSIRELGPKPPEPGPGTWPFRVTIYDYNNAQKALKKVQSCALSSGGLACGASNPSVELLELLDLRLTVDGYGRTVCAQGNPTYSRVMPSESFNTETASDGMLTRLVARKVLLPEQMDLLHDTDTAHKANTAFRCGGPPSNLNAIATHRAFEATARDEFEHSLFRMPEFSTTIDPGYSPAQVCALFQQADIEHAAWMNAVMERDMAKAWRAGLAHSFTHNRIATKDDKLVYRVICEDAIETCPNSP